MIRYAHCFKFEGGRRRRRAGVSILVHVPRTVFDVATSVRRRIAAYMSKMPPSKAPPNTINLVLCMSYVVHKQKNIVRKIARKNCASNWSKSKNMKQSVRKHANVHVNSYDDRLTSGCKIPTLHRPSSKTHKTLKATAARHHYWILLHSDFCRSIIYYISTFVVLRAL